MVFTYQVLYKERMSSPEDTPKLGPAFAFAQIPELVGREFPGTPFVIEPQEKKDFESVTWIDRVYLEPDPPEFPDTLVEGMHTLSMIDAIQKTAFCIDPASTYGFNYGFNRVRFTSQVHVRDTIESTFTIVSADRRGDGYLMTIACELRVVGAEKPAVLAEWVVLGLERSGS